MKMINYEIRKVIGEDISATLGEGKSLKITISAPKGEEIAKKHLIKIRDNRWYIYYRYNWNR